MARHEVARMLDVSASCVIKGSGANGGSGAYFVTNLLLRTRSGALNMDDLFKGRHFDREIIILCVRWYLRFKHSFRDLVEMMAKRGISLAHTTIMRWIRRCVRNSKGAGTHFACRAGASWRVDETYVKIKGRWTYVYRAVDKEGKTVDFLLQAKRDVAASKAFFRRAFKSQGRAAARHIPGFASGGAGIPQRESWWQADHNSVLEIPEQPDMSKITNRSNFVWVRCLD